MLMPDGEREGRNNSEYVRLLVRLPGITFSFIDPYPPYGSTGGMGHLCKLHTSNESRSVNSEHHAHLLRRMFGAIFRHKNIFISGFLPKASFDLSELPGPHRFLFGAFTVLTSRHPSYFTITWSQNGRGRFALVPV